LQNKSFKFKLSDDGYYELLKFLPYFRRVNFFGIIGILVIWLLLFLYWNNAFQEYANLFSDAMFAGIFALFLSLIVLLFLFLLFWFRISTFLKKAARNLKEKHQPLNGEEYIIVFDQDIMSFLIGKGQHKIVVGKNLEVISTSRHLLFYQGDGKSQNKFYIPKNGDKEHQENIRYITDYLEKETEVQYKEKGKR
jgi:hypothetical protein